MAWKVVVDIAPKVIKGTKGCHEYVWQRYKTKKQAQFWADEFNRSGDYGTARVEKEP